MGTLAPVAVASVAGTLTAWSLSGHGYHIEVAATAFAGSHQLLLLPAICIICRLLAVGGMRGVTATGQLARRGCGDLWPAHSSWPLPFLALVLAVKIAASSISIGSGFCGGLFSTSLFLGALAGARAGRLAAGAGIAAEADITLFTLVGMAAFGAAVASAVFCYSFSTWRFHLRGEAIPGGEDAGWMHDTTAAALMRRTMKTIQCGTPHDYFAQRIRNKPARSVFIIA
jgi:chloride channel protein, CIC family